MNLSILKKLLNGITISQLEKELGFSNGSISKWEKVSPSVDKVQKIAKYFGVTTDYLLGLSDNPNPPDLVIPEVLKGVPVAFHRGEFENLTQDEVDSLARIATEYKAMREKNSKPK